MWYLVEKSIEENRVKEILPLISEKEEILLLKCFLSLKKWSAAAAIFEKYPKDALCDENSPLYSLFGIYLWAIEGKEIGHAFFSGMLGSRYPKKTALLSSFLQRKISLNKGWWKAAFLYEKKSLLRDLILLNLALGKTKNVNKYIKLIKILNTHST